MSLRFLSQILHGLSSASEPQLVVAISFFLGVAAVTIAVVAKICEKIKDLYYKIRNFNRAESGAGESM